MFRLKPRLMFRPRLRLMFRSRLMFRLKPRLRLRPRLLFRLRPTPKSGLGIQPVPFLEPVKNFQKMTKMHFLD